MTRNKKLKEILNDIIKYSYKPNGKYLYPLCDDIESLKKYLNYKSDVFKFNAYIEDSLLPGIDEYIKICKVNNDNQTKEMIDKDIKDVKYGAAYWEYLFREACRVFSIHALEEEVLEINYSAIA